MDGDEDEMIYRMLDDEELDPVVMVLHWKKLFCLPITTLLLTVGNKRISAFARQ